MSALPERPPRGRPRAALGAARAHAHLFSLACSLFHLASLSFFGKDTKLIYRHYATLYFVVAVDAAESELGILDLIQVRPPPPLPPPSPLSLFRDGRPVLAYAIRPTLLRF